MGPKLVDLLLEVGIVDREQMLWDPEPLPPGIVTIEAALEVARDRRQPRRSGRMRIGFNSSVVMP